MLHNQVYRGKKVLIIMRNGDKFIDQYLDTHNKKLEFKNSGRIEKNLIRSMTIYRAHSNNGSSHPFQG